MNKEKGQIKICEVCNTEFIVKDNNIRMTNKYCSRKCRYSDPVWRAESSERMKKWNKEHKEENRKRMKENNPGSDPVIREKGITTKRINGTLDGWKNNRGGNGKGLTQPQIILSGLLGTGWETEFVVKTTEHLKSSEERIQWRQEHQIPYNYKIDIANPMLKIAIEVDGYSHKWGERKMKDLKKTSYLEKLGWRVLRFTNENIMNHPSRVLLQIRREIKDI